VPAVEFVVFGEAVPQGSKRAFRAPNGRMIVADSSTKLRPWRQEVRAMAAEAWGDRAPITGPVLLALTFFRARPKVHYGSGARADTLRPSAAAFPTSKPDLDKLARSCCDSITDAGVWRDDSQVADLVAAKRFGAPCVTVAVFELPTLEAELPALDDDPGWIVLGLDDAEPAA